MKFPIEICWAMSCCLKHDSLIVLSCGAKNLIILLLLVILLILRRGAFNFSEGLIFSRTLTLEGAFPLPLRGVSLALERPSPQSLCLRGRRVNFLRNLDPRRGVSLALERPSPQSLCLRGGLNEWAVMKGDDEGLLILLFQNFISDIDNFLLIDWLLSCELQF